MAWRWTLTCPLLAALVMASGCPEPGEDEGGSADEIGGETGDSQGDTGTPDEDTGSTDDADTGTGTTGTETDDDDDSSSDTGDDHHDETDGDTHHEDDVGETGNPDDCWDQLWEGDSLPALIFADTTDLDDDLDGSCGGSSAPDFQLGFVAPWTGTFEFDTTGSGFDTVLHIDEGACGDDELACNDNFLALESRTQLHLHAGDTVTVTVDGADALSFGAVQLTIREAPTLSCDWQMISNNLPKVVQGDTSDKPSELASGCGGAGAPEAIYRFTAPGPGTYRFDTFGSSFDTVLYLLEDCDQAPLACNDDKDFDLQSELEVELSGGDKVLVVVDGHGPADFGPYLLNVKKL